jgi:hypothetical protein
MIITIYDYASREKEITLPDKEIIEIVVTVLSGDETGYIEFADGAKVEFDASDTRFTDFYDGCYTVKGERIQKWTDFKPSGTRTASYERQATFYRR